MLSGKDIILVADYHAENIEFRWFNEATGEERTGRFRTSRKGIVRLVQDAARELEPGGRIVWIMESTTGWARVQALLGKRARFLLANVLQMPLPPKGRRRKTDKIDTARILREYLNGKLPLSFQPPAWLRTVRRLVDCRQELVERQTAVKNWIGSLLHHETWYNRANLWSDCGQQRLRAMVFSANDRMLVDLKMQQLEQWAAQIRQVESRMRAIFDAWPEAQRVDEIRGIGMVTAVSMLARIGPVERFASAEDLIAYAGLSPGMWQSDETCHHGRIGGPGTDSLLRFLAIEATRWLREIPRYRPTYERALAKRGKKVARIVLARLLLRSVYKMLRDRVRFNPAPGRDGRAAAAAPRRTQRPQGAPKAPTARRDGRNTATTKQRVYRRKPASGSQTKPGPRKTPGPAAV